MISSSSIEETKRNEVELEVHLNGFEAYLHPKELEYLKERNAALIQSIKNRNVEAKTERHILSRLKVNAKNYIVGKMVEDNALLPYIWVEQGWLPEKRNELIYYVEKH
jgi:hypothetical protein